MNLISIHYDWRFYHWQTLGFTRKLHLSDRGDVANAQLERDARIASDIVYSSAINAMLNCQSQC